MLKIGLTGVHGSGKTTKAKELKDHFVDINKMVYVVSEVARNCPYLLGTVEAQKHIWHNQMMHEKYAMAQDVDVVICDRTVMDNLMYYYDIIDLEPPLSIAWDPWVQKYHEAKEWMATYDQVIRMPLNPEWLQADDPFRPKSEAFARRIDALFDQFVDLFVTEWL